jgi:hypothetical protein
MTSSPRGHLRALLSLCHACGSNRVQVIDDASLPLRIRCRCDDCGQVSFHEVRSEYRVSEGSVSDGPPPCPWCAISAITEISAACGPARWFLCRSCHRVFGIRFQP